MPATTTQTARLIDCPACGERIIANLTYSVKLNERVHAEGEPANLIDKTATATLTLTGVHIQHECPPPKPPSFFTEAALVLHRGRQPSCPWRHRHHPQSHHPRGLTMTDHRDAITGQYVTAEHAKTNPDTTVSESPCAECERMLDAILLQKSAIDHYREEVERLRADQPIVRTVGDLTARHVGRRVWVDGFEGELVALVTLFYGIITVEVLTDDNFSAPRRCTLDTPCEVLP